MVERGLSFSLLSSLLTLPQRLAVASSFFIPSEQQIFPAIDQCPEAFPRLSSSSSLSFSLLSLPRFLFSLLHGHPRLTSKVSLLVARAAQASARSNPYTDEWLCRASRSRRATITREGRHTPWRSMVISPYSGHLLGRSWCQSTRLSSPFKMVAFICDESVWIVDTFFRAKRQNFDS